MDQITAVAFLDELEKIAAEGDGGGDEDALLAAGGLLGGGYAAKKAKPLITGRTRLFHGTSEEILPKVLEKGVLPSSASGQRGITEILANQVKDPSRNLAFATRDPMQARSYAAQAEGIADAIKNRPTATPEAKKILDLIGGTDETRMQVLRARDKAMNKPGAILRTLNPFSRKGVAELDVPLWRKDVASKIRVNPEVASAKANVDANIFLPDWAKGMQKRQIQKELGDKVVAMEGGISPEFIRGSTKFKGLTPSEIIQYAKARPGRFAAGAGLGLLGVGAAAYGAHRGLGLLRKGMKQDASVDSQQG